MWQYVANVIRVTRCGKSKTQPQDLSPKSREALWNEHLAEKPLDNDVPVDRGSRDSSMFIHPELNEPSNMTEYLGSAQGSLNAGSCVTNDGYDDAPGAHRKQNRDTPHPVQGELNVPSNVTYDGFEDSPGAYQKTPFQYWENPVLDEPESEAPVEDQNKKTLEKRAKEIKMIQKDVPAEVVQKTPMGTANNLHVPKRDWEKAKAKYRQNLKISQIKCQTQYSLESIELALEIVHEEKMKASKHVMLALEFIPRLDGMLQLIVNEGKHKSVAKELLKRTYKRKGEVMISEQDHLDAALAWVTR